MLPSQRRQPVFRYILLTIVSYYLLYLWGTHITTWIEQAKDPIRTHSTTAFPSYHWRTNQTLAVTPLITNKWMRVESHTVQTESGAIIDDWIWMDVIDQVNVIPAIAQGAHRGNSLLDWKFLVLRQHKYGIQGETLAVVGGHIESKYGETPLQAAMRELREEVSLEASPQDWILLGRYRTNANRGGGYCSTYLAKNARPIEGSSLASSDDLEHQDQLLLTNLELRHHLLSGSFGEIKWTATVALALLQLETASPISPLSCILNCADNKEEQKLRELSPNYNPYHQLQIQPGLSVQGGIEHDKFYQRMREEAKALQQHGKHEE